MTNLEIFLDEYNNKEINFNFTNKYKNFGYEDEELFDIDLDFMLKNLYNIVIVDNRKRRLHQRRARTRRRLRPLWRVWPRTTSWTGYKINK